VTRDEAFAEVIKSCATVPRDDRTWITSELVTAYIRLHQAGHAHSVECWQGDELVGGIYGVAVGGLFAGESMFHRADDVSKIAIMHLVEHLRARVFGLFDIQKLTPASQQLGAPEIPRSDYLVRLAHAVAQAVHF